MRSFKLFIESRLLSQLGDAESKEQVVAILDASGTEHWLARTLRPVLVFNSGGDLYVIDDFEFPSPQEANDWLASRYNDISLYINCREFNEEFWATVRKGSVLYHGTTVEGWEGIRESGFLEPRDRTRGIGNRGTGLAIFLSESYSYAQQHYDRGVLLAVDVGRMKADGFTPYVSREGPVEEAECRRALASLIGVEDYHTDEESGIDYDTVVCFEKIGFKYLKQVK